MVSVHSFLMGFESPDSVFKHIGVHIVSNKVSAQPYLQILLRVFWWSSKAKSCAHCNEWYVLNEILTQSYLQILLKVLSFQKPLPVFFTAFVYRISNRNSSRSRILEPIWRWPEFTDLSCQCLQHNFQSIYFSSLRSWY